jgi:hypothetical protein
MVAEALELETIAMQQQEQPTQEVVAAAVVQLLVWATAQVAMVAQE